MARQETSNSVKAIGIEIINDLSTSGTLNFNNGYIFLGDSYQGETSIEKDILPTNTYAGTSESRGNMSRSLYNINTSGPILFGENRRRRQTNSPIKLK